MTVIEELRMSKKDLVEILKTHFDDYSRVLDKIINSKVNNVIRDKEVYIYCGKCGKNILFTDEPTVFGAKNSKHSKTYHIDCWKEL